MFAFTLESILSDILRVVNTYRLGRVKPPGVLNAHRYVQLHDVTEAEYQRTAKYFSSRNKV